MATKRCEKCRRTLPLTEFPKKGDKAKSRAVTGRCWSCNEDYQTERTHTARLKSAVIAQLGFWPNGCDSCQARQRCRAQGVWVDPPCALPDATIQAIISSK